MTVTIPETMTYHLYIDGQRVPAGTGATYERVSPANGQLVGRFASAGKEDVDAAIAAARRAFDEGPWRAWSGKRRAEVLRRSARLLEQNREELGRLESAQSGALLPLGRTIIDWCVELLDYYSGLAWEVAGRVYEHSPDGLGLVLREPVGVVGAIGPSNFPLSEIMWKVAPALAAGCTLVVKPPPETPITILALGEIFEAAGLPHGVYNVVTGGPEVGEALVQSPLVDQLSFTGGTHTGRAIMKAAADHTKRLTLEMGGKSANIVFDDADLDAAATAAADTIYYRTGQVCVAGSRLLAQRDIHDALLERVGQRFASLRIGDPLDPETEMGPLVSQRQLETVLGYCRSGVEEGARLICGGSRAGGAGLDNGFYVQPTIFADVNPQMRIAREEVFGPVLCVIPFDDEAEAIRIANDTEFGLAGAVWSRDLTKALRVARQMRAGTVWINQYGTIELVMPFGGFKQSGFGRELGRESVEEFTQLKSIHVPVPGLMGCS